MRSKLLLLAVLLLCLCGCALAQGEAATGTDLDPVSLELKPYANDALKAGAGTWMIPVQPNQATVGFRWEPFSSAAKYHIVLKRGDELLWDTYTTGRSWSADMARLAIGDTLKLTVTAVNADGESITRDTITVTLVEKTADPTPSPTPVPADPTPTPAPGDPTPTPVPGDPTPTPVPGDPTPTPTPALPTEEPGESPQPTRPSGGFPGGGRGGRSSGSTGIQVTPGKALTSAHANGTGDMTRYDTVTLALSDAPMTRLQTVDQALEITLDEGESSYTALQQEDELLLTPVSEGTVWQLQGAALQKLNRSGITVISLTLNGEELLLDTDIPLQGRTYASLRALGCADSTFTWQVDSDGLHCLVNGKRYHYQDGILTEEV